MAEKNSNVQIPWELFHQLIDYHLLIDEPSVELQEDIKNGLMKKLDSLTDRYYYSQYKTAAKPEDREKARQEYLNRKGIHKNFRW